MRLFYYTLFDSLGFFAPLAPLIVGALASDYVAKLNIALEGLILAAAFTSAIVASHFGLAAGYISAMLVCAALAWLADMFSQKTGADSFVVGLGLNMAIPAFTSILSFEVFKTKAVVSIEPLLSDRLFPDLAPGETFLSLLNLRYSDYASFALMFILALFLHKTAFGIRAKALGMKKEALLMAGLKPEKIQSQALFLSGLASGAAGATLAASVGAWVPNMSAGRGWIALVAVYLGGRQLYGSIIAGLLFAFLLAIATRAQSFLTLPADVLMAIPYLLTAIVIAFSPKSKLAT